MGLQIIYRKGKDKLTLIRNKSVKASLKVFLEAAWVIMKLKLNSLFQICVILYLRGKLVDKMMYILNTKITGTQQKR